MSKSKIETEADLETITLDELLEQYADFVRLHATTSNLTLCGIHYRQILIVKRELTLVMTRDQVDVYTAHGVTVRRHGRNLRFESGPQLARNAG